MTMFEAMEARHAVRSYQDKKIENVIVDALKKERNKRLQPGGRIIHTANLK